MAGVIIVDDDPGTLEGYSAILRLAGHLPVQAMTVSEALARVRRHSVQVALVDLRLANESGLDLIRRLGCERPGVAMIVVTAWATPAAAFEAAQLGAVGFVEKPLFEDTLLSAVDAALVTYSRLPDCVAHPSPFAALRWVSAVMTVVDMDQDVHSVEGWADLLRATPSTLRRWCERVGVTAKSSLDFARLLRATIRAQQSGVTCDMWLDTLDPRTLRRLARAAGWTEAAHSSVDDFLARQSLVGSSLLLVQLRRNLQARQFVPARMI